MVVSKDHVACSLSKLRILQTIVHWRMQSKAKPLGLSYLHSDSSPKVHLSCLTSKSCPSRFPSRDHTIRSCYCNRISMSSPNTQF